MSISELVKRPVETLPPHAACIDAALLMRDQRVGSVIVAENKRPLGIVTDRDLSIRVMAERRDPARVPLKEVMSGYPVYLSQDSTLDDAVRTMREMGVRRIPVVDKEGRLDGVLSLDDVLMVLGRQFGLLSEAIGVELGAAPLTVVPASS